MCEGTFQQTSEIFAAHSIDTDCEYLLVVSCKITN